MTTQTGVERVWEVLRSVPDPEIPVISLVDLGVVRTVTVEGRSVTVVLRPTYSGCPAMDHMRQEVEQALTREGFTPVTITIDRTSPWTTNALNAETRQRLFSIGIAPPPPATGDLAVDLSLAVVCPHCGSEQTRLDSAFGSTLCKQIFRCSSCLQAFERMKPL